LEGVAKKPAAASPEIGDGGRAGPEAGPGREPGTAPGDAVGRAARAPAEDAVASGKSGIHDSEAGQGNEECPPLEGDRNIAAAGPAGFRLTGPWRLRDAVFI
jgi:hypothetical protein